MALPVDLQITTSEVPIVYGVVLSVYPGDVRFGVEFQRDDDAAGSPAGSPVTVGFVEGGQQTFTDLSPASSATYHYRARHVRDGYTDGAWTEWVAVMRDVIPPKLPDLPHEVLTALDVNIAETTGVVSLYVNGSPRVKSVKWKTSLSTFPDATTGTLANTDAAGDVTIDPTVTLTVGQEVFVSVAFYGEAGALGPVLGTLRQSRTYQVNIDTLDELTGDFGTITAGKIFVGQIEINADTERILFGLASAPLTGVGIFMGKDGADYEFRAGDPGGDYIHWDGSSLEVVGAITATTIAAESGTVGGWTLSATELSSGSVKLQSTAERILLGAATAPTVGVGVFLGKNGANYEFRAGDPAGAHMHWDATDLILTGALITAPSLGSAPSLLGWINTMAFSATDFNTVAWGAGSIVLSDGTSYSIAAGNTGNMVATTYLYLDPDVSTTVLQATTTATTAVGSNKILVAVAQDVASPKNAEFVVYGGSANAGISKLWVGDNIAAQTIAADNVVLNTLTGAQVSTMDLTAKTFTATLGVIGGWTISGTQLSNGSMLINAPNEQIQIGTTAILTGAGVFLGKDAGVYKFRVGDPATGEYFLWNGTNLGLFGDLRVGLGGQVSFYDSISQLQGSITPAGTAPTDGLDYAGNAHFNFSIFLNKQGKLVFDDDGAGTTYIASSFGGTTMEHYSAGTKRFEVGSGFISMPSGTLFYPGGTASTYYWGTGGVQHNFTVSNTLRFRVDASGALLIGRLALNTTERLYFDGGSNTYIHESAADTLSFVTGGGTDLRVGTTYMWIPATNKFYLDGGGDTYIYEHVANETRFVSGGVVMFTIGSNHIEIPAGKALYLDGGSNTYIQEVSADKVRIVTAGAEQFFVKTDGAGVSAGDKIFFDGGGDTYIRESSANALQFVQGGTAVLAMTSTGHQTLNASGTGNWVMRVHNNHASNPWGILIHYQNGSPDDLSHRFLDCADSTTTRLSIYADGDVKNHDNSYGAISDRRLKQDIIDSGSQWNDLKAMRFRKWRFKTDIQQYGNKAKVLLGAVAQELQAISPGLVRPDADGMLGVNYSILYMKGMVALQEGIFRIESLEDWRTETEIRLEDAEAEIAALKAAA